MSEDWFRFTQDDFNAFIRNLELTHDLNELERTKRLDQTGASNLNEVSILTQQENALREYDKFYHIWENEKNEISKRTSKLKEDSSILKLCKHTFVYSLI